MSHLHEESQSLAPRILSPWQPPIVHRREPDAIAMRDGEPSGSGGLNAALVWHTWRRWWHVCLPIGTVLAGGILAFIWLTFHPVYKAEAWLKIESSAPFLAFQNATGGVSVGAQDVFVRTQLQLIRSPVVVEPLLERPEIASIPEIKAMTNPVAALGKAISVESENDSELYRISYSASSPQDAANVVNAVLQEYTKSYDKDGEQRRTTIIANLTDVANARKLELTHLRENVQKLASQLSGETVTGLNSGVAAAIDASPLGEYLTKLSSSEVDRAVLEATLQAMQASQKGQGYQPPEALLQLTISQDEDVKRQRAVLEMERKIFDENAMASARGANDPHLSGAKKRVADAEAKLRDVESTARESAIQQLSTQADFQGQQEYQKKIAELQAAIRSHTTLEGFLTEKITQFRQTHQGSGETAVMLEFARRDLARVDEVYELLQKRINELTTEHRAPSRVDVLRDARVPTAPTELLPWRKFGVGALAGVLVPFMLALLWEFKAQRISGGEELSNVGQLPLFGEITALPSRPRLATSHAEQGFILQRAAFEDSVHYLCRSMLLAAGDELRVIALTSAVSGEGKTSLSAQLSISLAQCTHEPIVLVDADVRDPDMHEIYDLPLSPGLVEVMLGQCSLSDAIRPTAVKNVYLLPAGRAKAHPHILLHQDRLRDLLMELRKAYRYVLLDTPPVLAVGESLSVCKLADGVLICALRDVSRHSQVQVLQQRLRLAGAKALGVVLSGVSPQTYASRYGDYVYQQKNA